MIWKEFGLMFPFLDPRTTGREGGSTFLWEQILEALTRVNDQCANNLSVG